MSGCLRPPPRGRRRILASLHCAVAAATSRSSSAAFECTKFPFNNVLSRDLPTTILPGWSERAAQRTADRSAPAAGTTAAAPAPPAWRGSLPRGYRATAGWLRCLRHGRRMIRPGRRWRGRLLRHSPKPLAGGADKPSQCHHRLQSASHSGQRNLHAACACAVCS